MVGNTKSEHTAHDVEAEFEAVFANDAREHNGHGKTIMAASLPPLHSGPFKPMCNTLPVQYRAKDNQAMTMDKTV